MPDIRALTEADLPVVSDRLLAEFPQDPYTPRNVQATVWGDAAYNPDLNLGLWDGSRLAAVLLGVRHGERAFIKALAPGADLDPAARLLAAFEERVVGVTSIRVSGSPVPYFLPGVDARDTHTLLAYHRAGYRRSGDAFNMACDLLATDLSTESELADLAGRGYRVARLRPDDREALAKHILACFSRGWLTETLYGLNQDPPTVHVAWHDGRIVAFAAAHCTNPGWFGPMGTDPAHRRAGLGRVLLRRCLVDLRELGYRQADIGWVGPLDFYARHCGARVNRVWWLLEKALSE